MVPLPPEFLKAPISHRALRGPGRPENSLGAVRAAVAGGYGIEIDVQETADGQAVVFHDSTLERLTEAAGRVRDRAAAELIEVPLKASSETIPLLSEVLETVAGRVPLLIEVKDQDGAMGPRVGRLERAVARSLAGYGGPVAVMSFNPHSVAELASLAPGVPRDLTTSAYAADDWPELSAETRDRLREIPDFDRVGASFISHEAGDLSRIRVKEIKARGFPILCWTIRSEDQERAARGMAQNITFEGYAPASPT